MSTLSATALFFLAFVATMAWAVGLASFAYLSRRTTAIITTALAAWLLYVGVLSASGIVADAALRPPAAAFILGPVFAFVILVVARSSAAGRVALAVPLPLLIGVQTYRVGVELFFHQLWIENIVPRMLTFEGANVDIAIGLSAPLAAWISTRGHLGRRLALGWTLVGLLALANVAIRAVLTTPGPLHLIHAEVPNLSVGTFPFTYIAGFFAPLAVTLHVLALRALLARGTVDPS